MKNFDNVEVYAFVGPSGTGKSYRAQMVASAYNLKFIIDDGLLVENTRIAAGISAKKAPTKIETIKRALFKEEEQKNQMIQALKELKPEGILILGTSNKMVEEIARNLTLPKIKKFIYITDVASSAEIENARRVRITEGKHVIPVPTFEIKKDFSGFLLDPLQIFKNKGLGGMPYVAEKSIIRPTFNYIGNFTISDTVFKKIIEIQAKKYEVINRILRIIVDKSSEIYVEVEVVYGFKIDKELEKFAKRVVYDIERLTSMNILKIEILAKKIKVKGA